MLTFLWRKRTSNSSSNKANKVRTRGRHGSRNNLTRHCPRPCALVHSPVLPSPSLTLPSLSLAPLSWLLRRRPYPSRHCPKQPLPSSSAVPPIDPLNFVSLDSSRFEHYSLYRPNHPSPRFMKTNNVNQNKGTKFKIEAPSFLRWRGSRVPQNEDYDYKIKNTEKN